MVVVKTMKAFRPVTKINYYFFFFFWKMSTNLLVRPRISFDHSSNWEHDIVVPAAPTERFCTKSDLSLTSFSYCFELCLSWKLCLYYSSTSRSYAWSKRHLLVIILPHSSNNCALKTPPAFHEVFFCLTVEQNERSPTTIRAIFFSIKITKSHTFWLTTSDFCNLSACKHAHDKVLLTRLQACNSGESYLQRISQVGELGRLVTSLNTVGLHHLSAPFFYKFRHT